jgi:molecular chaperone DnaJ
LSVKVPAGVDMGQRLKLRGEGDAGIFGGPPGDLYVLINVGEHPIFDRDETEIICEMPLSYSDAVLGAEVLVPTLDGEVNLKIPAGTESGKVFRLRGKGAPVIGTQRRGDQHVRVYVNVPTKVSDEHRALLEQLKEHERVALSQDERGFFEKMKNMFAQ